MTQAVTKISTEMLNTTNAALNLDEHFTSRENQP